MHNDTRMNVLIALTACQHGAVAANYTEVRAARFVPWSAVRLADSIALSAP